jgi:hypothetical protein
LSRTGSRAPSLGVRFSPGADAGAPVNDRPRRVTANAL